MKNENMIDFLTYREHQFIEPSTCISEELQVAIQSLIYRLRELGPLPQQTHQTGQPFQLD